MSTAVLDIGKTNIKLVAIDEAGRVLDQRQRPNRSRPGPPWLHPDLEATEAWLAQSLHELAARHGCACFVASGHGSGGVLVDDDGAVVPSIDYEAEPPAAVLEGYARIVPPFPERGAPLLPGASHFGRQLFWIKLARPEALARARHFLALPQYFAWRLTGVAASNVTMLGAQSHLWSPLRGGLTTLVDELGCRHLLPPLQPSWQALGPPRPAWRLPAPLRVLTGIHDSTANLYLYQRAELDDFALLSTGTWIVGMSTGTPVDRIDERRGMGLTADVYGRPVAGVLAMTGREYAVLTQGEEGAADPQLIAALVQRGIMALPSWTAWDGIYPGSAGRGRIVGQAPAAGAARRALATLYAALVAADCLDLLAARRAAVLDGSFTAEPAFAGLVAAFRPDLEVLVEPTGRGVAGGAALLASHGQAAAAPLRLERARPIAIPDLTAYRARWRAAVALSHGRDRHEAS